MSLDEIIDDQSVLANVKAQGKKQLLLELAQAMASRVAIDHRVIFETLLTREKLGSTGIGQGIAIPHARCPHSIASTACLRAAPRRSISSLSMGSPSILSLCCWRRTMPEPIT